MHKIFIIIILVSSLFADNESEKNTQVIECEVGKILLNKEYIYFTTVDKKEYSLFKQVYLDVSKLMGNANANIIKSIIETTTDGVLVLNNANVFTNNECRLEVTYENKKLDKYVKFKKRYSVYFNDKFIKQLLLRKYFLENKLINQYDLFIFCIKRIDFDKSISKYIQVGIKGNSLLFNVDFNDNYIQTAVRQCMLKYTSPIKYECTVAHNIASSNAIDNLVSEITTTAMRKQSCCPSRVASSLTNSIYLHISETMLQNNLYEYSFKYRIIWYGIVEYETNRIEKATSLFDTVNTIRDIVNSGVNCVLGKEQLNTDKDINYIVYD